MYSMHICMVNITSRVHVMPHPSPIYFYGERAQQWAYTGRPLQTVLLDIPIQQISTESTIFTYLMQVVVSSENGRMQSYSPSKTPVFDS